MPRQVLRHRPETDERQHRTAKASRAAAAHDYQISPLHVAVLHDGLRDAVRGVTWQHVDGHGTNAADLRVVGVRGDCFNAALSIHPLGLYS